MSETADRETVVELFVRAEPELGAERCKESVVDRLEELESEGHVDSYSVNAWSKSIRTSGSLAGTAFHEETLSRIEEFESWIRSAGNLPETAFARETVASPITGEEYAVVTLPVMCLAVYEDDELVHLHPGHDGLENHSVHECLDALAGEDVEAEPEGEAGSEQAEPAEAR